MMLPPPRRRDSLAPAFLAAAVLHVGLFLIATYAGQLVNITLAVLIARYDEAKDEARAKKIYNRAFVVVPAFTVLAWVASILV